MTQTVLNFENYPMFHKKKPKHFSGVALISLNDHLRIQDEKTGVILVPAQRVLNWTIDKIELNTSASFDEADLHRFIRGRYWPKVERLLYAQFCHEKGRPDLAKTFEWQRAG